MWIPFFAFDNRLTYPQIYSYSLSLYSLFLFFITFCLSALINLLYKRLVPNIPVPKTISSSARNPSNAESDDIKLIKPSTSSSQGQDPFNQHLKYRYLQRLSSMLSWISCIFLAGVPVCISAFDFLPIWISIILTLIFLLMRATESFYRRCSSYFEKRPRGLNFYKNSWLIAFQHNRRLLILYSIFIISASFLMPFTTYKSCVNDHVEGYGIKSGKYIYSSAFTRYLTLPKVCGEGGPCHIYATVPFNSSSSVFINIHTSTKVDALTINYDTTENFQQTGALKYSQKSSFVIQPDYDVTGDRNIHSVLLSDLLPDQSYTLQVFYNSQLQATKIYKTLPDSNAKENYTLVYGGDIGRTTTSQQMARLAAEKDPRAIIVGGDLSYDDGTASCYYSMDLFLWMMDTEIFDKVGRLVPMMFGLGNHDVGFSSHADVNMPVNKDGPSFYTHFPQSLAIDNGTFQNTVPQVEDRKAFRAHMIGNLLHVFLDSAYMSPYNGDQLEWLKNISETYKDSPKIAIYHDPIFSPCYRKNGNGKVKYTGADDWVPVFTKYKYMIAFENHIHMYKKSYPLIGTEVAQDGIGTLYLGDGSWGPLGHCVQGESLESQGIFESYAGVNHIWVVEIDPVNSTISATPLGLNNIQIDKPITQELKHYAEL